MFAYRYVSPEGVYAGYEAMAIYVEVSYYEQHEVILGGDALSANPALSARFAPVNDPRAGYNYFSLAPGKLVVVIEIHGQGFPSPRSANVSADRMKVVGSGVRAKEWH